MEEQTPKPDKEEITREDRIKAETWNLNAARIDFLDAQERMDHISKGGAVKDQHEMIIAFRQRQGAARRYDQAWQVLVDLGVRVQFNEDRMELDTKGGSE